MTYDLYPSAALVELRARYRDYEICAFDDHHGRPFLCAVLRPERAAPGVPPLVTASGVADLEARLADARVGGGCGDGPAGPVPRPGDPSASPHTPGDTARPYAACPPGSGAGRTDTDAALTARLRDAIYVLKDRGLLPRWQPSGSDLPHLGGVPAPRGGPD